MSYNPITFILIENKVLRHNYIDWKRNLYIVLITEKLKWAT